MTDEAKAPTDPAQQAMVPMVPIEVDLPTGRPATVIVPLDMTDSEWFALATMLAKMRDTLRRQLEPQKPQIVRANAMPTIPAPSGRRRRPGGN